MRRILIGGGVTAAVLVASVLVAGHFSDFRDTAQPQVTGPATTVPIVRQTLTDATTVTAEIGYGTATPLQSRATGTLTWLPSVGTIVARGDTLFRADEIPTVILYGPLPMYRPLTVGTVGPDVKQFEQNLRALGYTGFTIDQHFDSSTLNAMHRWQTHLGIEQSDSLDMSRVVYVSGPVRVNEQLVQVGADATGALVKVTATTKVVTATVQAVDSNWATIGAKVDVVMPDNTTTPGVVAAAVRQAPSDTGGDNTVAVTVTVAAQSVLKGTDAGIRYVAAERPNVLTVPIAALLALPQGGYGLELSDGRLVPVQTGLFANGQVEISGSGLVAGQAVGMPQ